MLLTFTSLPPLDQSALLPASLLELNDIGVLLMKQQQRSTAISVFQTILRRMSMDIGNPLERDQHSVNREASGFVGPLPNERTSDFLHLKSVVTGLPHISSPRGLAVVASASASNPFNIFNRAFVVPSSPNETNLIFKHLPFVVIYNIGLIYHQLGCERESARDFRMAEFFYRQALVRIEKSILQRNYAASFNLLILALFNNLGHVHSHFYNASEASHCRQQTLMTFLITDYSKLLNSEEYLFFYLNLLLSEPSWPKFAPAA
jgi:hypothetical protein